MTEEKLTEEAGRRLVLETGRALVALGLVKGTWGNVSLRLDEKFMLITPSGVDYAVMTEEDIVKVNLEDGSFEGRKPSSEKGLHIGVYRERKEVRAVIHHHAQSCSTCAAAGREVPAVLDDLAQIVGPTVRVAPYALPSTKKIVKVTLKALRGRMAALMANHGAVCLGRDMAEAVTCSEVLEKGCRAFIEASFLGGAKEINRFEAALMHQVYLKKYSKLRKG